MYLVVAVNLENNYSILDIVTGNLMSVMVSRHYWESTLKLSTAALISLQTIYRSQLQGAQGNHRQARMRTLLTRKDNAAVRTSLF
jgi:hypothetical protein